MITVTDNAAKKIGEIIAKEKESGKLEKEKDYGLRVGVQGGGCSGFQYIMDFDTLRDDDQVFEANGTKVYIDPKSLLYLSGSKIDYIESPMQSGFKIENPNTTGSCGCGQSVSF